MIRSVEGLEKCGDDTLRLHIEYDVVVPHQLKNTFETKIVQNLFTAGRWTEQWIWRSSGQGSTLGLMPCVRFAEKSRLFLAEKRAYIGVLVDDGSQRNDRTLPSIDFSCECRLLLRHDNADLRLTEKDANWDWLTTNAMPSSKQNKKRWNRRNQTYAIDSLEANCSVTREALSAEDLRNWRRHPSKQRLSDHRLDYDELVKLCRWNGREVSHGSERTSRNLD